MGGNPSEFRDCGDSCPIENVSWNDIQDFIEKLNEKTGRYYRLPTEAEWEYAARSGGKGAKWSGTNDMHELAEYAWYADNAEKKTHPVGKKKPNSLGIHDMSGNITEWVRDRYDAKYYKQSPKENPRGPQSGGYRVLRGGSFYDNLRYIRTTYREEYPQSYRISSIGFRLVMAH
jgi:formylglycine-generating enzyme required for sulfatase activity